MENHTPSPFRLPPSRLPKGLLDHLASFLYSLVGDTKPLPYHPSPDSKALDFFDSLTRFSPPYSSLGMMPHPPTCFSDSKTCFNKPTQPPLPNSLTNLMSFCPVFPFFQADIFAVCFPSSAQNSPLFLMDWTPLRQYFCQVISDQVAYKNPLALQRSHILTNVRPPLEQELTLITSRTIPCYSLPISPFYPAVRKFPLDCTHFFPDVTSLPIKIRLPLLSQIAFLVKKIFPEIPPSLRRFFNLPFFPPFPP